MLMLAVVFCVTCNLFMLGVGLWFLYLKEPMGWLVIASAILYGWVLLWGSLRDTQESVFKNVQSEP